MNLDQAMGGIKTVTTNGKTGGGKTFDWTAKHYAKAAKRNEKARTK